jgi:hypothetical protein
MKHKESKPYCLKQDRIIDDVFWNLANVKKAMDIEELLDAFSNIIDEEGLPLEMEFLEAHWRADPDETRKRIMVSLKDHLWRNIKILVGLDYMGKKKKWLQIQMLLIDDPYFTRINNPLSTGAIWAILGIPLLIFSALYSDPLAIFTAGLGLAALGYYAFRKHKAFAVNRERHQQIDRFAKEIHLKSNRTYKIDDVRQFSGAMQKVIVMTIERYLYMNEKVDVVNTGGMGSGFLPGLTGSAQP